MTGPDPRPGERPPADRSAEAAPSTAGAAEPAALRDANAIAVRVAADEAAADAERERLTREPLPTLAPDADPLLHLQPGEVLHAQRRAAVLERGTEGPPSGGTLSLTSERLIHIGSERVEVVWLRNIADMAVALERLLLVELRDGSDLAVEVDQPRLLRVQVAAARASVRERGA